MNWITNKTLKTSWFGANLQVGLFLVLGCLASLSTFFLSLMVGWFYDLKFREGVSKSALIKNLAWRFRP